MNNKYYLATVLLALGAFSPLYGVQNTPGGAARPTPPLYARKHPRRTARERW